MPLLEDVLRALDDAWDEPRTTRATLRVLGSGALMLQTAYERGTKDGDVLEAQDLPHDVRRSLLRLAGPKTALQARFRLYIDLVPNGLPFLPQAPRWHRVRDLADLRTFDVHVLDVVDVVVSKLKRFSPSDATDVAAMIEQDLVPHDALLARFRDAVDLWSCDARAPEIPRYVAHLHRIERDLYLVEGTEIELPAWI